MQFRILRPKLLSSVCSSSCRALLNLLRAVGGWEPLAGRRCGHLAKRNWHSGTRTGAPRKEMHCGRQDPHHTKEATMRCKSAVAGIEALANAIVSSVVLIVSQGLPPTVAEDSFCPAGERSRSLSPPGGTLNAAGRVMFARMVPLPLPLLCGSIKYEIRPYRVGESLTATRLPPPASHTRGTARASHSVRLRGSSKTSIHFIRVGNSVCDGAQ